MSLRNRISSDSEFPPETNRYILYVSFSCPFAHRALVSRALKGLNNVIQLSVVHPTFQGTNLQNINDKHIGWVFRNSNDPNVKNSEGFGDFSCEGCIPDPTENNFKTIREIYEKNGVKTDKYSVPVLWDNKLKKIVNNDSNEIITIFNNDFNNLALNPNIDLLPKELSEKIEENDKWIIENINLMVYKCGFAETQEGYDKSINLLFDSLDRAEEILSKSRYLNGDLLTTTDIKLFTCLTRFDEVYYILFKCNKQKIENFPNLLNFCRDIYQLPGIADTIKMKHIKVGYFSSNVKLNPLAIIPIGSNSLSKFQESHSRDLLIKK